MKQICLLLIMVFASYACNRNYYPTITIDALKKDGWYQFKDFKYSGNLENGKPNGDGIIVYSDGTTVTGLFDDGVLIGDNVIIDIPTMGIIKASAANGLIRYGTIEYKNGDHYLGGIYKYIPNGKGILAKRNGDILISQFKNGYANGDGSLYKKNTSETQIGNFINGKPDGQIVIINKEGISNGKIFENGYDKTEEKINFSSKNVLDEIEKRELDRYEIQTQNLSSQIDINEEQINQLDSEINKNYSSICSCRLSAFCLTIDGYCRYNWGRYFGKSKGDGHGTYVHLPCGSKESVIKAELEKEREIVMECQKWNKDPKSYTGNLERKLSEFKDLSNRIKNDLQRVEREKQRKIEQQERDRGKRLDEIRLQKMNELQETADAEAKSLKEKCNSCTYCCGCMDPESVRECIRDTERLCVCQV